MTQKFTRSKAVTSKQYVGFWAAALPKTPHIVAKTGAPALVYFRKYVATHLSGLQLLFKQLKQLRPPLAATSKLYGVFFAADLQKIPHITGGAGAKAAACFEKLL